MNTIYRCHANGENLIMSKKLLEENTIRQFMKLANIEPSTTSSFLKEKYDRKLNEADDLDDLEEEPEEEMELAPEEEMDLGEEPEEEMDLEEEPEEDAELIVDPDDAPVVIKFLENLLGLLKEEAGSGSEDMEMELEPEEEMGGEELAPEEEEMPPLQMEAMVNKIASRVAKRILSKK